MSTETIEDVLRSDGKRVVETPAGRYVYCERDDGVYEWDREASENVQQFPSEAVERAVEHTIDSDIADVFPLQFTVYAHDDSDTNALLRNADLPSDDGELTNLLYYYPGELEITYELRPDGQRYELDVVEIQYEGKTLTPDE